MIRNGIEYRPWPRRIDYLAGSDGSVIGPSGRILKQQRHKKTGYFYIKASMPGGEKSVPVHVMVNEAWHGLRPEGKETAHGNGVRADNRPQNLRWATHPENMNDMIEHGTRLQGERIPWAKLTEADVYAIRTEYTAGMVTFSELSQRYGVSRSQIRTVVRGETWAHVEGAIDTNQVRRGVRHPYARFTESDVREIRRAVAAGTAQTELAERYGAHPSVIGAIVNGLSWRHVEGAVSAIPRSHLSEDDVRMIRSEYASGRVLQRELAERYGVDPSAISSIVRGVTWRHIATGPPILRGPVRGERNGFTHLTEADVRAIRAEYAGGGVSQSQLAKRYGVSQTGIGHIVRGVTWKHVTDNTQPRVVSVMATATKKVPKISHTGGTPVNIFRNTQLPIAN